MLGVALGLTSRSNARKAAAFHWNDPDGVLGRRLRRRGQK